jgi:lysophospholipase L1-like esterase
VSLVSLAGVLLVGCSDAPSPSLTSATLGSPDLSIAPGPTASDDAGLRYVALGDSYTIGIDVKPRERWTNQLVRVLRPDFDLQLVANLATSSATSQDVIEHQLPGFAELRPEFVTLLVGVNDVIFEVDPELYRLNLGIVFDAILRTVPVDRILVVTTPDYTLTPHGGDYHDREQERVRIANLNALLIVEAASRGLAVVDITPVSNRVPEDATLLANDGMHPSGKQYAGWVELIAPIVRRLLAANP